MKFKFLDRVKVNDGFYIDAIGEVTGIAKPAMTNGNGIEVVGTVYKVKIEKPRANNEIITETVEIPESQLIKYVSV